MRKSKRSEEQECRRNQGLKSSGDMKKECDERKISDGEHERRRQEGGGGESKN